MRAAVILGAGWSFVAGLPLARDLFSGPFFVASHGARRRAEAVVTDFVRWLESNPKGHPELFIQAAYRGRLGVRWEWVAEFLQARLASPVPADSRGSTSLRYGQRITTPTYCPMHTDFWVRVLNVHDLHAVVTTNYDLLAERSLRHRPMKRPPCRGCPVLPGFHYGGLGAVSATGLAQPWTVRNPQREVTPTGHTPLCKLHGSLNWALMGGGETCGQLLPPTSSPRLVVYQDPRPAFRHLGAAAIVPPLPEKETPPWATGIWATAEQRLAEAELWLVVGYSLPPYDFAVRDLLARSAAAGVLSEIHLHDPHADTLRRSWAEVTGIPTIRPAAPLPFY